MIKMRKQRKIGNIKCTHNSHGDEIAFINEKLNGYNRRFTKI